MTTQFETVKWLNQTIGDARTKFRKEQSFRKQVSLAKRQLDAGLLALGAGWIDRAIFKFVLGLDADQGLKSPKRLVAMRLRVYGKDIAKTTPKAIYTAKRIAYTVK